MVSPNPSEDTPKKKKETKRTRSKDENVSLNEENDESKHPIPQPRKKKESKRKRSKAEKVPINQQIGRINPRTPHPRDLDQPTDYHFKLEDIGQKKEGENFDKFEVEAEVRRRGSATCESVLIMKYNKPLPMWFDVFLCPRVMPGKWCGYVAYAFRRRIRFGSWPNWADVPEAVKDQAWEDILASWDFRTLLTEDEHLQLRKKWTTYASDRMRNWRTVVARRYIWEPIAEEVEAEDPCQLYRWMDPKEWAKFVVYRTSPSFLKLRLIGKKNAEQKQYIHTTGSGGYRLIYIQMDRKKRIELVNEKVKAGMTTEEAEAAVAKMNFKVDRSLVFIEGNRNRKTGKITQQFVADLEPEILRLNKEQDAGNLKIEGKKDILVQVTKKDDHCGRYRGCPGTAKLPEAHPEYYAEKVHKKRCYRPRKKPASPSNSDAMKVDLATLASFADWFTQSLGIEKPLNITPMDFLRQRQCTQPPTMPGGDGEGGSGDEDPTPCYLNIQDSCGTIKRVAAGVVITRPQDVLPQPCSQCVRIQPPILLPDARLPYYDLNYKTVGAALGAAINWPEEFIEYMDSEQPKKEKPKKPEGESSSDESVETRSEGSQTSEADSRQKEGSRAGSDLEMGTETNIPVIDPHICTPTTNVNWEFAHHVQDPTIRKKFQDFLIEMQRHPKGRDVYRVRVNPEVFGSSSQKVNIPIDEAQTWTISTNKPKKMWISTWQMDMWSSFLYTKLPEEDRGRVQLIPTHVSYMEHTNAKEAKAHVIKGLIDIMTEKPARLYVMPSCREQHWMLFLIFPEESLIYCIDSNGNGVATKKKFEYDLLMRFGVEYDEKIRAKSESSQGPKEWKIINIKHKHQPFLWECGYYCMLYVEKIILLHPTVDVQKVFPQDFDAYPMPIIEGLVDTFCRYVLEEIAPQCRLQNDTRKRNPVGATGI